MVKVRRPALRYHGSKWRLAPWIISHFPPHRVYVEPYSGGGAVLLGLSVEVLWINRPAEETLFDRLPDRHAPASHE